MRFILATARKDLRRFARDPVSLLLWLGIPVFVAVLLSVVFGGGQATPHGVLLVADEDGTFVSGMLATAFSQGELGKMFVVEKTDQTLGRRRMRRGEASALLVVPKGFSDAVLRDQRCELKMITNPSQSILPQIAEETVSILVEGAFYLNAVAGEQLRVFAGGPPGGASTFPDATIARISTEFNRLAASVRKYVDPPLIKLESAVQQEPQASRPNMAAMFFPSMLGMSLVFLALGLSGDIWKERAAQTLRRVASTPAPMWSFLVGKLAAAAAVFVLPAMGGLVCARWLLDLTIIRPLVAGAWLVASGAALYLILVLLQTLAGSARAANLLANFCIFPLAMMGGAFFPFEVMPAWMAVIGRRTPVGWALTQLRLLMDGKLSAGEVLAAFAVLGGAGALMCLVTFVRLRRSFAQ